MADDGFEDGTRLCRSEGGDVDESRGFGCLPASVITTTWLKAADLPVLIEDQIGLNGYVALKSTWSDSGRR